MAQSANITRAMANPPVSRSRGMVRLQLCLIPARCISILLLLSAMCSATAAQPVKNQILSGYQVRVERKCWLFKINFNHRIRYISHFPTNSGTELRIMLHPIRSAPVRPGRRIWEGGAPSAAR